MRVYEGCLPASCGIWRSSGKVHCGSKRACLYLSGVPFRSQHRLEVEIWQTQGPCQGFLSDVHETARQLSFSSAELAPSCHHTCQVAFAEVCLVIKASKPSPAFLASRFIDIAGRGCYEEKKCGHLPSRCSDLMCPPQSSVPLHGTMAIRWLYHNDL